MPPKHSQERSQQARRRILHTILLAGGVLGAALAGYLPVARARQPRLRPPGALDEADLLASCIKCGQCVQACPVQAIRLADLVDGHGNGIPYIDARAQACDFSCDTVQCVHVCPTGSLTFRKPVSLPVRPGATLAAKPVSLAKQHDPDPTLDFGERMGIARLPRPGRCLLLLGRGFRGQARGPHFTGKLRQMEVDPHRPIPVRDHPYDLEECDLCVRECPIKGAIAIRPMRMPNGRYLRMPAVDEPCVGCGVCEMICPVDPPAIVIVPRGRWRA